MVSAVSYAEIAIKVLIGRILVPVADVRSFVSRAQEDLMFELLPLTHDHALAVSDLPMHHRDPFDRLLVAQALTESVPLISSDRILTRYRRRHLVAAFHVTPSVRARRCPG